MFAVSSILARYFSGSVKTQIEELFSSFFDVLLLINNVTNLALKKSFDSLTILVVIQSESLSHERRQTQTSTFPYYNPVQRTSLAKFSIKLCQLSYCCASNPFANFNFPTFPHPNFTSYTSFPPCEQAARLPFNSLDADMFPFLAVAASLFTLAGAANRPLNFKQRERERES